MNRFKQLFIFYFFVFHLIFPLQGKIIEAHSIKDLSQYLQKDTLIVFDIDNTLLECRQTFGSDQWFGNQIQHHQTQGSDYQTALNQALKHWVDIQHQTHLQLIELQAPEFIKELQQLGYPVMALTTRGEEVASVTLEQLNAVNICMTVTAPYKEQAQLKHEKGESLCKEGVLFTAGGHKGYALAAYLKKAHYVPKRIVFINDKHSHLLPVEEMAEKENIEFIGLRYSQTDQKVQNYRKEIADIQQEFYQKILSDEAAEAIWQSRQLKDNK